MNDGLTQIGYTWLFDSFFFQRLSDGPVLDVELVALSFGEPVDYPTDALAAFGFAFEDAVPVPEAAVFFAKNLLLATFQIYCFEPDKDIF